MTKKLLTALLLITSSVSLFAQQVNPKACQYTEFADQIDSESTVLDLEVKSHGNSLFFNLKTLNEDRFGSYVFERSTDDGRYEVLQIKPVTPSNSDIPLSYFFADKEPQEGKSHYRILQVYAEGFEEVAEYTHDISEATSLVANAD